MPSKKTHIKNPLTKILLIIIGIIVALLLTINNGNFISEDFAVQSIGLEAALTVESPDEMEEENDRGTNRASIISYTSVFHYFTENLPHTNKK